MNNILNTVWVFHGANGRFSSGVFSSVVKAEEWIRKNKLTGVLTEYPIDEGAYDWAVKNEFFEVKKIAQSEPQFIQNFTCASQDHYHFENGERE